MKKIYALLLFLIVIASQSLHAQVDPLYAQYINNPVVINPAYAGLYKELNVTAGFRKQWAGFDGSPSTLNVTGHMNIVEDRMGAGLMVVSDQVGENKNTLVQALYSYKLKMNDDIALSFGLQAGFMSFKSNNSELNPYNPGDPYFTGNQNITKPTFGAGVILISDRFFLGIAVPRMLKTKTSFTNVESELYTQHFYAQASYLFIISENVRFRPTLLLKGVSGAPLSTDVNLLFVLKEKYSAGLFTRNLNTYGVVTQIRFASQYRFGYVFEMPTNKSVGSKFISHEVTLGLNLSVLDFHDHTAVHPF